MIGSTRVLLAALCVVAMTGEAGAQERRRSPAGEQAASTVPAAAVKIPDVPRDPARPFVGVWEGSFHEQDRKEEKIPFIIVIEFLNGEYSGYSFMGPMEGAGMPIGKATEIDRVLGWERKNMGEGMLVYRARLAGENALEGTMILRGGNWEPAPSTFSLRRRGAKP